MLGRTPAALDVQLDPLVRGIGCRLAQGSDESPIEVADARNLVVEDRRAVGDGTAGLAKRMTMLTRETTVLTARDVDG